MRKRGFAGIDRRTFVMGSVGFGVAALTGGALAGCAAKGDPAATDAVSAAGDAGGSAESESGSEAEKTNGMEGSTVLCVCFSATGTTRTLAEYAADILEADWYEIVPEVPYTEEDLAYYTDCRADREQNGVSARPAISGGVKDMGRYDTVLLGYPIWHGQAPRIISTFLESYDFSGKTILPFCTSHSSGIGSSATDLQSLTADASWLEGERFSAATTKEDIAAWLESNGLPKSGS